MNVYNKMLILWDYLLDEITTKVNYLYKKVLIPCYDRSFKFETIDFHLTYFVYLELNVKIVIIYSKLVLCYNQTAFSNDSSFVPYYIYYYNYNLLIVFCKSHHLVL